MKLTYWLGLSCVEGKKEEEFNLLLFYFITYET